MSPDGGKKDFEYFVAYDPDCLIDCVITLHPEASFQINGMPPFSTDRIVHFPDAIDPPYSLLDGSLCTELTT